MPSPLRKFEIPVKPHVQKYMLHHLGAAYKLSTLDPLGRHLRMLLQQPRVKKELDAYTARYTAKFALLVKGSLLLEKRFRSLSSKDVIDFNNFVEAVIKTEFHGFVAAGCEFGMSEYGAIQRFRAKYDFQDEDISFDTLKKSWQRHKQEPAAPGIGRKLVAICPPLRTHLAA
ncbi:hypothetical protein [Hymenobacter sp. PAMC 26628]|uniref:hypothetical protein n=1 Tax=Hymenobacter sp. PAMC 26628 TaxID=1484118 RepID=UPI00076FFFFD|nr:hypothetical protein [Hymenobacter sp. PAMC 26628]AMJ65029.1 hypothetical protein AXW84_06010 [Hymenobacter sp. PAMC 26628]